MDLTLSRREQSLIHQLLEATPEPGDDLLPRSAVEALVRLIPCDMIGAGEMDRWGYEIRGFDLPEGHFGDLGPQVCEGPVPTGLVHLADHGNNERDSSLPQLLRIRDTLRVGFPTSAGTVVQLYLDRRRTTFTARDVALLSLLEPVLGRLMTTPPRLSRDAELSGSEMRVLELVAAGRSNREVADRLSITVATVRKHLEHAYRKLGVTNRTAAVAALTDSAAGVV